MNILKLYAVLIVVTTISFPSFAGITYDGTNIVVSNYPCGAPATVADIRAADALGGWGIVQYDPGTATTTLTNPILVGGAYSTNTFFQIGRMNSEALVLKGNLWVKAPASGYQNGLLLGTPTNSANQPVLKFDCSSNYQFGLYLDGGVLTSYNATVTSTTTNRWYGSSLAKMYMTNTALLNCCLYPWETLAGWSYNCTYAKAPWALRNGSGYYEGCVFSNLDIALKDSGYLECTAVGCVFTNNVQNWTLAYTDRGIRLVDCQIGPPSNTNIVCQRYYMTDHWHYPSFMAQRHFVVRVKTSGGLAITNATVAVSNEQANGNAVIHSLATTGATNLTPAVDSGRALFVTDYLYEATEDAANPLYQSYTYTLTTSAPGYQTNQVTGIDPDESWTVRDVILTP